MVTLVGLIASAVQAANFTPQKYAFDAPPSARLEYKIESRQKGFSLSGSAIMQWRIAGKVFTATNEVHAMLFGKILDARTEGSIDPYGLAPASFTEKRLRKEPTTTSFDRTGKSISFTGSDRTYPIQGGEQDRNSVIWQLIAVARAAPGKFTPGSEWRFFVAGQRDAEPWTFKVVKQQQLRTPLGQLETFHIQRAPTPGHDDQQLDIWLAPKHEWYPVRLRFSEANGDFIEQTLETIEPTAQ